MSRYIFKYVLDPATGGQHAIPHGSFLLDLQMQDGAPVMWWSVPSAAVPRADDLSDESKTLRRAWPLRTFVIAPTGGPYTDDLHYAGTFQLGGFVGHVLSCEAVPREQETTG